MTDNASIVRQRIIDGAALAVIRLDQTADAAAVGNALLAGGVATLEVTMTSPGALELIAQLSRACPDALVGVGSVLDRATVNEAVAAGARFVVSPITVPEIIEESKSQGVPVCSGAFSPTEIQWAHSLGADFVKVFPADVVGMSYFKSVRAPMPHLKLIPTGGVTLDNAGDWLRAGAVAVGVGSALVNKRAIADGDYDVLTANARKLMNSIDAYRNEERG